jgi:hypothetical protein
MAYAKNKNDDALSRMLQWRGWLQTQQLKIVPRPTADYKSRACETTGDAKNRKTIVR